MNLTERQDRYWRAKAIEQEKHILDYFARHPDRTPDGSWVMSAFKSGFYMGQDRVRKQKRQKAAS